MQKKRSNNYKAKLHIATLSNVDVPANIFENTHSYKNSHENNFEIGPVNFFKNSPTNYEN